MGTLNQDTYEKPKSIKVYPNPTDGIFTFENQQRIIEVNVYNLLGQLVINIENDLERNTVDISSLEKGIYLLKLQSAVGYIYKTKILKK